MGWWMISYFPSAFVSFSVASWTAATPAPDMVLPPVTAR
jgi:hypothetical protein